jgi:molybdate transport system regulatory protein
MNRKKLPITEVLGFEAGDKRIDILRRIGEVGSISEAARGAGVSYKAAWQALETLTNLAGTALVEKVVGGSGGGGAKLTDAGHHVLEAAQHMTQARQQVLAQLTGGAYSGRAAMALRTSMRNQFPCTVVKVTPFQGLVRVQLRLAAGSLVHSRVTRESVQLLGLKPKLEVLALCKATAVKIAQNHPAREGCNLLPGVVARASQAIGGGEVSLRLPDGVQLVGFAAAQHGLTKGVTAIASIDESGIVIAASS